MIRSHHWRWSNYRNKSSCYKRCAAIYDCGGVPAKPIRKRFDEMVIKELLKIKWWDWTKEKIARNIENIKTGCIERLK